MTGYRRSISAAIAALMLGAALPSCAREKEPKATAQAGAAAKAGATSPELAALLSSIKVTPAKERIPVPDIDLSPLGGGVKKLSDYRGKALLLNFWATWCPPCRAEMPSMQRLRDALLSDGVAFEIIAVDVQEKAATVRDFVAENGYRFPIFLDEKGGLSARFVNGGIPTSYVVDKEGRGAGYITGSIEWDAEAAEAAFRLLAAE